MDQPGGLDKNRPAAYLTAPLKARHRAAQERKHMQKITFPLQGHPYVELNQLLKLCGLCDSGGAGKQLVAEGHVRVDGKAESRKTCKISVGQKVAIGDVLITVTA